MFYREKVTLAKSAKTDKIDNLPKSAQCENGVKSQESVEKHRENTFTQKELREETPFGDLYIQGDRWQMN